MGRGLGPVAFAGTLGPKANPRAPFCCVSGYSTEASASVRSLQTWVLGVPKPAESSEKEC